MSHFGWEVVGKISGGRFSDIYKVSKANERIYALKIVDPDDLKPPHSIRNEIKILEDLENAKRINGREIINVVSLIDVKNTDMEYGLLFPYYDMTLYKLININIKKRSKFNPDGSIDRVPVNKMELSHINKIIIGILQGLEWIHSQNIIHRDINPNNILFSESNLDVPVIIDFGISYQGNDNNGLESSDKKFTDIATGIFKAPELLLSKRDYTNKVDIWAVGVIMTLLLSDNGESPFDDDSMHSDLVLLSNIISTFGSPPSDWSDCKTLSSFESMNNTFFTKPAKPLNVIVPKLFNEKSNFNENLEKVFTSFVSYECNDRLTASDALKILLS